MNWVTETPYDDDASPERHLIGAVMIRPRRDTVSVQMIERIKADSKHHSMSAGCA